MVGHCKDVVGSVPPRLFIMFYVRYFILTIYEHMSFVASSSPGQILFKEFILKFLCMKYDSLVEIR